MAMILCLNCGLTRSQCLPGEECCDGIAYCQRCDAVHTGGCSMEDLCMACEDALDAEARHKKRLCNPAECAYCWDEGHDAAGDEAFHAMYEEV